jgi:hypothetical protein
MIYYTPDLTSPVSLVTPQDVNETCDYTILWGDNSWETSTVYRVGDRIVPTDDLGIALVCITPGVSGTTEPTWTTWGITPGTKITDGSSVVWKVTHTLALLETNETIETSAWTSDTVGVTLSHDTHTFKTSTVFVSTIPSTVSSIIVTNTITTSNSTPRIYERSMVIPVSAL